MRWDGDEIDRMGSGDDRKQDKLRCWYFTVMGWGEMDMIDNALVRWGDMRWDELDREWKRQDEMRLRT